MPWRAIVIYKALIITNFIIKNQLSWEKLTISSNRTITFLSKFIHHISMYNRLDWIDAKTSVPSVPCLRGFGRGWLGIGLLGIDVLWNFHRKTCFVGRPVGVGGMWCTFVRTDTWMFGQTQQIVSGDSIGHRPPANKTKVAHKKEFYVDSLDISRWIK